MRLERLHLERWGAFTDTWLDLRGDGVRLHVLHGPNEAGKSTIRAAVTDLLFGIETKSPFDFRHGYRDMRIGAEIVSSDGRKLAFRRRKGNANTLLTAGATETPLPDGAIAPFLGGTSRSTFVTMFALDQARLREGGNHMIGPNGDLARSLLEAGTGMADVGAALKSWKPNWRRWATSGGSHPGSLSGRGSTSSRRPRGRHARMPCGRRSGRRPKGASRRHVSDGRLPPGSCACCGHGPSSSSACGGSLRCWSA